MNNEIWCITHSDFDCECKFGTKEEICCVCRKLIDDDHDRDCPLTLGSNDGWAGVRP